MADFCAQCSEEMWGKDFEDLAGLVEPDQVEKGVYALVICEGCGATAVDHEGRCVASDCLQGHGESEFKIGH